MVRKMKLSKRREPVILEGEDGEEKTYLLIELDGNERDRYMNLISSKAKFSEGKVTGVRDFKGIHSGLLTKCMREADLDLDDNGDLIKVIELGPHVDEKTIQSWPSSVREELYELAQKMNALATEDSESEAKND